MKGREVAIEYREEVGTKNKAQAIVAIIRSKEAKPENFTKRAARALQGLVADKEVEKWTSRKLAKRASLREEK